MGNAILTGQSGGGLKPDEVRAWMRFPLGEEEGNATGFKRLAIRPIKAKLDGRLVANNGWENVGNIFGAPPGTIFLSEDSIVTNGGAIGNISIKLYGGQNPASKRIFTNPATDYYEIVYAKENTYPDNDVDDTYTYFYVPITDEYMESGLDTSDANATATDIILGKTAYVNGVKVVGTFEPIVNLVNSISYTGTYASTLSARAHYVGFNTDGDIIIAHLGANDSAYENIYFTLDSVPSGSGITLVAGSSSPGSSITAGSIYYGAILRGVTRKVNLEFICNTRNSSSDYYQIDIKVTYA